MSGHIENHAREMANETLARHINARRAGQEGLKEWNEYIKARTHLGAVLGQSSSEVAGAINLVGNYILKTIPVTMPVGEQDE